MTKRILIDTDPGIDDALALILALGSPELDVAAITTVCGNVDVDTATRNLFTVLNLLPGPWPVLARGAARPLVREPFPASHIHGLDGLGGRQCSISGSEDQPLHGLLSPRDGADEILHQLNSALQPLTIVSLGPLTNLALARNRQPDLFSRVKELIMMGGAYLGPGNITPAAEFNIFADPEAAETVMASGIPITAVGLDITRQVRLDRQTIEELVQDRSSRVSRSIQAWTGQLLETMHSMEGSPSIPLHDPLAVLVCLNPDLVRTQSMHVEVETQGRWTTGMTLADRRPLGPSWKAGPNLEVCVEVKAERALRTFLERIP